ncbi:MAG: PepSY-associated TM helix domain-containing protein [Polyangiales bacterium]
MGVAFPRLPQRAPSTRLRDLALIVHRYVGLATAAFLLLAGLTGSVLAFYTSLDAVLNPELFVAADTREPALDPFVLQERFNAQLPEKERVHTVMLHREPGRTQLYYAMDKEVFVDPHTGAIRGSRTFGELSEGRKSFMTFLYELHFTLASGDIGIWLMGSVAALWTLDCFVGAYLTFPPPQQRRTKHTEKPWLTRWLRMWLLKTNKLFTLVFTWHRASGLWVWMMLLVFAWSGVALNLGAVYEPLMAAVFGPEPDPEAGLPTFDPPREEPELPLREAYVIGRRLMAQEAATRHFEILGERHIAYRPEHGTYNFGIESSLDVSERLAETSISFDSQGKLLAFHARTGQHAGSTLTTWLVALHFGAVRAGGLAYRSFVCALGVLVALLSISGVWIWLKKPRRKPTR